MKNYAIETDIITTPDPVFFIGDVVNFKNEVWKKDQGFTVRCVTWNTQKQSWEYEIGYRFGDDLAEIQRGLTVRFVSESELKLINRKQNLAKLVTINGKQVPRNLLGV